MSDSAGTEGKPFRSRLDSPLSAAWILALASIVVLIPARGYLGAFTPLGDDASSHITTIATLAEAIRSGTGWWSNDYNGGFPMGLYYQPLPHVASALVCAALGGATAAGTTYKALLVAMLALQPWAVWAGLRRAGFRDLDAAIAGFVAPLVINGIQFGYHAQASLSVGLYTQAWGNVALPLAFGELAAIGRGAGRSRRAIVACALVASTHMFYAIALVVPGLLFAVFGRSWRRSAWQLPVVGVGTFVLLSPWMIPLSRTQAFFGGWPFGRETRVQGYGWTEVFSKITSGQLMDGDGTPVLGALAALGVVIALGAMVIDRTEARRRAAAFAAILLGCALVGTAGRAGVGGVIDLVNPLHRNVQLFRYGAVLQFALLAPIGLALGTVARMLERRLGVIVAILALGGAVVLPVKAGVAQLDSGFRTIDQTSHFRQRPYGDVVNWLRQDETEGRMYIGKRSGLRGHYHSGLMAWMTQRPAAQSYGVGLHDSLHFYTLEYLHPDERGAADLAVLYDFRLFVHSRNADLSGLNDMDVLYRNTRYVVSRMRHGSEHAVEVMREADTVSGTPRGVRQDIRAWMWSNGVRTRQTVVLEVDDPASREHLLGHPGAPDQARRFEERDPVGETLESHHEGAEFTARVRLDEPGLIVAKIGYHPFWRVELDGERVETVFAYPGFVAVRADAGEHEVRGWYRWPAYSRWLMLLAPLPLFFVGRLDRSLTRRFGRRLRADDTTANAADAPPTSAPDPATGTPDAT